MSDDFDDDAFFADDSFLREVDSLTAHAVTTTTSLPSSGMSNARLTTAGPSRAALPQRVASSGPSCPSRLPHPIPSSFASHSSSANASVGPSRPRLGLGRPTPIVVPSSDDFDDLPLDTESLAALDAYSAPSLGPARQTTFARVPSANASWSSGRGASDQELGLFQTHLNFRRDKQSTKGKTWDRTAFAASGRRIGVDKKGKNKWKAGSDDEEPEDDWDGPLLPDPAPLVNVSQPYESQRHLINAETMGTYIYPTNRSKRDYQYEIVRACFQDNCLVALPTGLGKTFVAGVVMLNFYRWFPSGKIVFLAPTKPLVNQQIEACQLTCGIPSADAAVMTGQSVSAKERAKLWDERRVFYCTPQTLYNDLKNGSVDPRDIVLAVFDEAHKASGGYAYTTILSYVTAHHPYFRVLALTATPGADVPRVQAVVDALHISRIEIREAEAPEIRKYMNEKPQVAQLVKKEILNERDLDCARLKSFRLTAKRMEILHNRTSGQMWAIGPLNQLEKMTRAMAHLLEFSLGMCHTTMLELAGGSTKSGKKVTSKPAANSLRNNFEFQKLLQDVEVEMNRIVLRQGGKTMADKHPKMQKTLELLLAHFAQAAEDEEVHGTKNDTRAMVFCSFRECVLEIVDMLNEHSGLLKATKFVGQSQGKQEKDKGFNQKEQKKTINEFKEGIYNVLVSTSIGEEGLDIGEVDFVVIYDMPKQSIKLLQRIGRTGRKRDGQVHVLMSEDREDANWDKAQTTHREIQEEILHSRNLELFDDVEPLIPRGKFPECVEMVMEVDPWDPGDHKRKKRLASAKDVLVGGGKGKEKAIGKKKRVSEVPAGAEGFKSVAQLLREKGGAKGKKRAREATLDDEGDEEEEGEEEERIYGREPSDVELDEMDRVRLEPKPLAKGRAKGAKSRKIEPAGKRGRGKAMRVESEDEDEDHGSKARASSRPSKTTSSPAVAPAKKAGRKSNAADVDDEDEGEDADLFFDALSKTRQPEHSTAEDADLFIDALSTTRHPQVRIGSASPVKPEKTPKQQFKSTTFVNSSFDRSLIAQPSINAAHSPLAPASPPSRGHIRSSPAWASAPIHPTRRSLSPGLRTPTAIDFLDGSPPATRRALTPLASPPSSPHAYAPSGQPTRGPALAHAIELVPASCKTGTGSELTTRDAAAIGLSQIPGFWHDDPLESPVAPASAALSANTTRKQGEQMPPPPLPVTYKSSPFRSPLDSPHVEATQFPIRRGGRVLPQAQARAARPADAPSSVERNGQIGDSPLAQLTRLRRRVEDSDSPEVRRAKRKRPVPKERVMRYLDIDVEISGSEGSPDEPSSDVETESDRRFAGHFAATQTVASYDQSAAYLAGLSTQGPRRAGLAFRPDNRREQWLANARRPVLVSDDEGSENAYELGSFVVDDDDDLGCASQSSAF
ncbi:3'-5' DNA helicase [Cryptotrichosporon argae]